MGPRDLDNGKIELARRDTRSKEVLDYDGIDTYIKSLLDEIQANLYNRAFEHRKSNTHIIDSYEDFKKQIKNGGFFLAHWDGTKETELLIKEQTQATIRCIPLDDDIETGKCMVTGKESKADYLKSLGAKTVVNRAEFDKDPRLIDKGLWDGVVDTVGGKILANAIVQTNPNGIIAVCGNANTNELNTSVIPFMLRGIKLW